MIEELGMLTEEGTDVDLNDELTNKESSVFSAVEQQSSPKIQKNMSNEGRQGSRIIINDSRIASNPVEEISEHNES